MSRGAPLALQLLGHMPPDNTPAMGGRLTLRFHDWQRTVPLWAGDRVADVLDTLHYLWGASNVIGLRADAMDVGMLPHDFEFLLSEQYTVWAVLRTESETPFGIFLYAELACSRGNLLLMVAPDCCAQDLHPIAWAIAGSASAVDIVRTITLHGGGCRFARLVDDVPLQLQMSTGDGAFLSWTFAIGRRPGTVAAVSRRSADRRQYTHQGGLRSTVVDAAQANFRLWLPEGGL